MNTKIKHWQSTYVILPNYYIDWLLTVKDEIVEKFWQIKQSSNDAMRDRWSSTFSTRLRICNPLVIDSRVSGISIEKTVPRFGFLNLFGRLCKFAEFRVSPEVHLCQIRHFTVLTRLKKFDKQPKRFVESFVSIQSAGKPWRGVQWRRRSPNMSTYL